MSFSSFFDAEKILTKFIVLAVTFRKMHGREVVSFHRVASLTAYKYLRWIIVLFLVSHCIKVYNICSIHNIHRVYSIYKVCNLSSLLLLVSSFPKMIISCYYWRETFSRACSTMMSIWFINFETVTAGTINLFKTFSASKKEEND